MRLVEDIAFRDPTRARAALEQFARVLEPAVLQQLEALLGASPDADSALAYLASLREREPEGFRDFSRSTRAMQLLVTVFSYSRFLSQELLANPRWIEELLDPDELARVRPVEDFIQRLERFLEDREGSLDALVFALFRRKQLLRILLRDVMGLAMLSEITAELSNLADAIIEVAYRRIRAELIVRYGTPAAPDGLESGYSIIALGKLGGGELNYSSDIDLLFIYGENGETAGPHAISNKEFYKKLANRLTELLSTYTAEGLCYRVDLRLRPEGSLGEVCISVDGAIHYYRRRARDWELQMLIKARPCAGDRAIGRELLDAVEPLIYSSTLDFSAVESMSATRDRINEKLAARRAGGFDVKLARGGIRDIEFLVQCLQRLHGGRAPWIRHAGTLLALSRLQDKALISTSEHWRLASAYQFLRHLEHRLQFADDRQTHMLPSDPAALDILARRMPANQFGAEAGREQLLQDLNRRLEQVIDIYERIIHAQKPMYYTVAVVDPEAGANGAPAAEPAADAGPKPASNLIRALDRTAPGLAERITNADLDRGFPAFEHFLEHVLANTQWMNWLEIDPVLTGFLLDVFEHSPYFAEQLVRYPDLIEEVREVSLPAHVEPDYLKIAHTIPDPTELRRFFRREMVHLQFESICIHAPIFDTLGSTSNLADAAIAAAYRMALEQTVASKPPESPLYAAADQLMVIGLGRLGLREFDLASDADLIFVLPETEELPFWTRVAERLIDILTVYTGDGTMFTVDTRLRPNGREGALVQSAGAYRDYFARGAEAWEGISYMKSRAIAGNMEAATEFLHQLQDVDWRRWGQSGRSRKDLRQMRLRLEKEQGAANPLKAGRGGFYDIDFALMYLRLKGAGLFFKVLNTPERIDIIEKMGHLDREDAAFFRDAAVFYRAVDHALRLYSGHAEGSLPASESKLAALEELVRRWTPGAPEDEGDSLRVKLAHLQSRTREVFERLFA
jgi:[glutamine synthetase] adenylyltransferase / [glutamine synthetase]-adenylyl-L-tyrosine phosphorylase